LFRDGLQVEQPAAPQGFLAV